MFPCVCVHAIFIPTAKNDASKKNKNKKETKTHARDTKPSIIHDVNRDQQPRRRRRGCVAPLSPSQEATEIFYRKEKETKGCSVIIQNVR